MPDPSTVGLYSSITALGGLGGTNLMQSEGGCANTYEGITNSDMCSRKTLFRTWLKLSNAKVLYIYDHHHLDFTSTVIGTIPSPGQQYTCFSYFTFMDGKIWRGASGHLRKDTRD